MTRKALWLALLLPMVVLAVKIGPIGVTRAYLGDDVQPVLTAKPVSQNPPRPMEVVGSVDTVGGTQFDIWFNGPQSELMFYDVNYGIHASFMWSNGTPSTDRNMRYNFWDKTLNAWSYSTGPDFMLWGVNTFDVRTGFGMLDGNATTGAACISAHRAGSSAVQPTMAMDQTPGGGSFVYCPGEPNAPGHQWPSHGLTSTENVHVVMMENATTIHLDYSRIYPWCTWSVPISAVGSALDAGFPDYNIATSHMSTTVAAIWPDMNANPATQQMRGHLRFSHDDGNNWDDPIDIGYPPAYGGMPPESLTYDINSLYGMFDDVDSFHLVCNVQIWAGGVTWGPSEIWHYDFTNGWHLIHQSLSDSFPAPGSNCTYAGRATLACNPTNPNEFVCVWEQLDSTSWEPNTSQAKFHIIGARSNDGGLTWGPVRVLANEGTESFRYPFINSRIINDTCHMMFLSDQEAGFAVASPPVGTMTMNPVIHQKFWKDELSVGIAESKILPPARTSLSVTPNPFSGATTVAYALPRAGSVSLKVYDRSGRAIRTLVNTRVDAGRYAATWNGCSDNGSKLTAGVYFVTLTAGNTKVSQKLTIVQ